VEKRTCFECAYCVWDRGLWLRSLASGFPARPMCANHPDTPGKLREMPLDGPCRNFRKKRRPRSDGPWAAPAVRRPAAPEDNDEVRHIPLTQGLFATVDAADYEELSQYTWCVSRVGNNVYAARTENGRKIYLHRHIMKPPKGMVVDHVDHNGLNGRRSNLRVCTPEENSVNKKPRGGSSQFVGVQRHKDKWQAGITHRGEVFYLGLFEDEVEAARARDRKAVEVHGRLAYLNFPEEWTLGEDGVHRPARAG
jgi:hypothetical protein